MDKKSQGYWSKERCYQEALKYTTFSAFKIESRSAYETARREKWLQDIGGHMTDEIKPKRMWTKEKCIEEASKYETREDFHKNAAGAYFAAYTNKWLDEACEHMQRKRNPKGFWTKRNCRKEALLYETRKDFQDKSPQTYQTAVSKGWINEICRHMNNDRKPKGYWNFETCQEEALKYTNKQDFYQKSTSGYVIANKNGWLDLICAHMLELRLKKGNYGWYKEACQKEASKYKTKTAFYKKSKMAYFAAYKNEWLDEFFPKKKKEELITN